MFDTSFVGRQARSIERISGVSNTKFDTDTNKSNYSKCRGLSISDRGSVVMLFWIKEGKRKPSKKDLGMKIEQFDNATREEP